MRRGPILQRIAPFMTFPCRKIIICGINLPFGRLSPSVRQVAHVLLTRPPLVHTRRCSLARLACVKHAASVHPEPGSNSQFKKFESKLITHLRIAGLNLFLNLFLTLFNFQRPCRPQATYLSYHLSFFLSITFFKVFLVET